MSETTVIVAGVLGVFLALGFAIAFWAFNKYKTSFVRAYQRNELGISDPIGQDLKALAMKMAQLENEIDDSADCKTAAHVKSHIKMKQELVRLGRELLRQESDDTTFSESSYEQKI